MINELPGDFIKPLNCNYVSDYTTNYTMWCSGNEEVSHRNINQIDTLVSRREIFLLTISDRLFIICNNN